jgi:class 3 adenylate cyclase/tetratricopeptide (TPR) repeat protein
MNCPNCQTKNPDEARFCFNCGTALSIECSHCGTSLQPVARFCHNCGRPVTTASDPNTTGLPDAVSGMADETAPSPSGISDQLQRYIPKELLSKLESARSDGLMQGERRVVTILFCDVKGSTQAASDLDPEEWAQIINGAFEHMIQPIYRYEGTVARLQGDGLLAFFGAPIAHEDDPQRAVLAGLDIVHASRKYGQEIARRWGIEFNVRVGINTGLVVVGAVGSDLRVEYTALGDAINLAARMEQTAQPGSVQIAEPTFKLVAPLFDFEVIKDLEVKGRDAPVTAYRVLSRKREPGSLRGVSGLSAPLIGRKSQWESLYAAWDELSSGRGQVVSVLGEAGLGKSRLIAEFKQVLMAEPANEMQWLEGNSQSYEKTMPFAPFIQLFNSYFHIDLDVSDQDKYEQIADQIDRLFPGAAEEMAPFFATLLDLELEEGPAERVKYLEPQQRRSMIFSQVSRLIETLMASQAVILFLDDLHWADSTSLDLLQSLLPLTDRGPLMIISDFRSRRQEASWAFHEIAERDYYHRYRMITLDPLDQDQARELVANLLKIEDLPEKIRFQILEKAEGNPFFVEEIIRSLLERDLVARVDGHWIAKQDIEHIDIPDTLTGVIAARLDRLDEIAKDVLQAAAVIGREFIVAVLGEILETSRSLETILIDLQRRELVREKSIASPKTFSFKHVLTQEATYNSILLSNRRELHRRTADVLIDRYPEAAADISRHLLAALQPGGAIPYLVTAGEKAARAYATDEAIAYFEQVIENRSIIDEVGLLRRAYEGLGSALSLTNQIPEAQMTFRDMLTLAESEKDVPMQISALNKLASVSALQLGQFQEAEPLLTKAESLYRKHDEKSSFPETAIIRCMMCTAQADFTGVKAYMSEVVGIGQELGSKEHILTGLEHVATSLVYLTEFDEALEKGLEGLRVAREIGDREHEAGFLALALPACHIRNGDFEEAIAALSEGLEIATRIGHLVSKSIAAYLLGEICRWRGNYEKALQYGHLSLEAARPLEPYMPFMLVPALGSLGMIYLEISEKFTDEIANFHQHALRLLETPAGTSTAGTAWADLGHCAIALGDLEVADDVLQKGLNYPNMFMYLERARHLSGAALLASVRGEHEAAVRLALEAHDYAKVRQMRHHYPLTNLIKGKVLVANGEIEAGLEALEQAEGEALELNMRPIVWQARAEEAAALEASGQRNLAEDKRNAAKAMVVEIANLFADRNLRKAFLSNSLEKIR